MSEAVSPDQLLKVSEDFRPCSRRVDHLVHRIARRLKTDPRMPTHILTAHGTGYRLADQD
jgi:DNA-binding response OmpR family regulator